MEKHPLETEDESPNRHHQTVHSPEPKAGGQTHKGPGMFHIKPTMEEHSHEKVFSLMDQKMQDFISHAFDDDTDEEYKNPDHAFRGFFDHHRFGEAHFDDGLFGNNFASKSGIKLSGNLENPFDKLQPNSEETMEPKPDDLPALPADPDPLFRKISGKEQVDTKHFEAPAEVPHDLKKELKRIQSCVIEVDNKQDDLANQKRPYGEEAKPFETAANDLKGEDRKWNNWVVPTYNPVRASLVQNPDAFGTILPLSSTLPVYLPNQESSLLSNDVYSKAKAECDKTKTTYRDPEFPADPKSIMGRYPERLNDPKRYMKDAVWCRPGKFFKGEAYSMYEKGILDPDDIKQGELGDCYFLVALASLAQFHERLKRVLRVRRVNDAGIYCVSFCLTGIWEEVIVDDRIPCYKISETPIFSHNLRKGIWVALLEKAWAKLHGGYLNVEVGTLEESIHALTGAPTIQYSIDENEGTKEEHWDLLLRGRNNNYVLAAATREFADREINDKGVDESTGLVRAHAYSIMGVYEVAFEDGKPRRVGATEKFSPSNLRLLKLRNPWGDTEWTGGWSAKDERWTPELKELMKLEGNKGGVFFIGFDDFTKHFSSFVISKYRDDYKYSGIKLQTSSTDPTILQFNIKSKGKFCITLSQVHKRFFPDSEEYVYSACSLFVAKIEENGYIYEYGCNHQQDMNVQVETELLPGSYVAYFFTPWRRKVNEIGFSIYGPEQVEQVVILPQGAIKKDFVMRFFIDKAKKIAKTGLKPFDEENCPGVGYLAENATSGMGFVMFDNKSNDTQISAVMRFGEAKDTEFYPPMREQRADLIVPPGHARLIAFRMTTPQSKFEFQQQVSYEYSYSVHVKQIKSRGTCQKRLYQGKEVGINLYVLKYQSSGFGYLYENTSKDFELKEFVEFDLKNCQMTGGITTLYIELKPGKSRLIFIMADGSGSPCEAKVKECSYDVIKDNNMFLNSIIGL